MNLYEEAGYQKAEATLDTSQFQCELMDRKYHFTSTSFKWRGMSLP